MQFDFFKYQGTGNDFVIINNHKLFFPKDNHELIRRLCDRKFGIGADGLMLLEQKQGMDFKMVYYNSDGKESTMCGNGGRCISAFAYALGIAERKGTFLAIDGIHHYEIQDDIIRLQMIDVTDIRQDPDADAGNFVLFTGSPHYVSFRTEIEKMDLLEEARKIRYKDVFAQEGINVNVVELNAGKLLMRTYERGVENETLSCGTGTVAVALCFAHQNMLEQGTIEILTPGGNLAVSFQYKDGVITNIWLEGPAKLVFAGTIDV